MCSCAALAALNSLGTWPLAQAAAEAASRLTSTRNETPAQPVPPSPLAVLPQIPEAISALIETLPAIAVLFAVAFGIVLFLLTLEPRKLDEADERREGCRANDAPPWEGSESELSLADTPKACNPSGDRKREEHRKVEAPRHRACGRLTLKATAGHGRAVRALCSIEGRMLTLSIAGGEGSQSTSAVAMKVPVEELAVGMQRGRADMFKIATLHKQMLCDEICCFTDDQAEHDEWIAVFRRMCVPILHFREAVGAGARDAPLDDVHSPPSEHGPARWASAGAADVVAAGKTIKGDKNEKQAREREKASVDSSKRHAQRDLPPRRT